MQGFPFRCLLLLALGAAPAAIAQENCVSGKCAAPVQQASMLQVKEAVQSKAKSNATAVAVSKHRSSDGSNVQASVDPVKDTLTGIEKGLDDDFKKLKASESWQAIMKAAKTAKTESERLYEEGVAAIEKEIEQIKGEIDKNPESLTHHFFTLYDANKLKAVVNFVSFMQAAAEWDAAKLEPEKENFFNVLHLTTGLSDNFQFTVHIVDEVLKLCDKITEEVVKLSDEDGGKDWKEKFDETLKDMHTKADTMRDFYQEAITELALYGVIVQEFLKDLEDGSWASVASQFPAFQQAVDGLGKMWAGEVDKLTDAVEPLVVELQSETDDIHVQALKVSPEEPEGEESNSGSFR